MKDLTVQQKNYLTKRIDSITQEKLNAIEDEYKGKIFFKTGSNTGLDPEAAEGVLSGKVKLKTEAQLLKTIADQLKKVKAAELEAEINRRAGRYYGQSCRSVSLSTFDFVDKKSVAVYHKSTNEEATKLTNKKAAHRKNVMDESIKVKDSVILEGSAAAVALLEKFANKKF